jgi:hypothetical protein
LERHTVLEQIDVIALLKEASDRLLGRGEAAITVPPMDGPLKPNHIIDNAEVVAELDDGNDLASDGETLWIAEGRHLLRLEPGGEKELVSAFPEVLTALARLPAGGIAAAIAGKEVVVIGKSSWASSRCSVGGKALGCVTALSACRDGGMLATDSSADTGPNEYARDLLSHGKSGRICRLTPDGNGDRELVAGLRYPFGAYEVANELWFSESWNHRVAKIERNGAVPHISSVIDRLPAYPSRMSPAAGGGMWLTCFTARRRLVEFVLREDRYRRMMMQEVDPRFWVAPMLSSGQSFLEPLQGGNVKTLGISKPWAPPRSYGLVVRLGPDGLPKYSLHSRADGHHHGIVSAVEANGYLYLLSKGAGLLLRVDLAGLTERDTA